jgi:hypothetical protein
VFAKIGSSTKPYNNERVDETSLLVGAARATAGAVAMAEGGHGRQNRTDVKFMLLRLLTQSPSLSQRHIASRLNVSLGCANYCLRALGSRVINRQSQKIAVAAWETAERKVLAHQSKGVRCGASPSIDRT